MSNPRRNIAKYKHKKLSNLIDAQDTIATLRVKHPHENDASFNMKSSIISMALSLIEKEIALLETSLNIKLGD